MTFLILFNGRLIKVLLIQNGLQSSADPYGGYATLSGITFTPELYTCAIDLVGPSNVRSLLQSFPEYWKPVKARWIRRIGDVEKDDALNQRISPLFHVDKIRVPLLIGHGVNDRCVKLSESEAIVKAMREKNLPVTFVGIQTRVTILNAQKICSIFTGVLKNS